MLEVHFQDPSDNIFLNAFKEAILGFIIFNLFDLCTLLYNRELEGPILIQFFILFIVLHGKNQPAIEIQPERSVNLLLACILYFNIGFLIKVIECFQVHHFLE